MKEEYGVKVQITSVTPRRRRRSWFVILSNADNKKAHEHSNPIVQQQSTRQQQSLIPSTSGPLRRARKAAADSSLREQLDVLRKEVESKNLLHRLKDVNADEWGAIVEAAAKMGILKTQLLQQLSVDDMGSKRPSACPSPGASNTAVGALRAIHSCLFSPISSSDIPR
mmetsp:Transcript_18017/g.51597  ORF Transcript_18017/g.51597 Transcript_18017/m.51597 type:complete len:168 (+) Transcript_18017:727-1230(+)